MSLTVVAAFMVGVLASHLLSQPAQAQQDTPELNQTGPVTVVEAVFDVTPSGARNDTENGLEGSSST
jgi:hypothetical protein